MAALRSLLRILLLYFWACSIIAAGIINAEEKKFIDALLKTNSSVDVDGVHHVDLDLNPDFNVTAFAIDHGMDHFYSRFGRPGQHYDIDDSRPFILCEKFNDTECRENGGQNCTKMEKCFLDGNKRSYGLGCMSVFEHNSTDYGNETNVHFAADPMRIKLKGCWPHDPDLAAGCLAEEECLARQHELPSEPGVPGSDPPLFCCCKTHMCNKATFIVDGEVYITAFLKKRMRIKGIPVTDENLQRERAVFDAEQISTTEAPNSPPWEFQDHIIYSVSMIVLIIAVFLLVAFLVVYFWWSRHKGGVKKCHEALTATVSPGEALRQKKTEQILASKIPNVRGTVNEVHVAHGRFGEVYRADLVYNSGETITVAIKKFKPEESSSWMTETEIFAIPALRSHSNIVNFLGTMTSEQDMRILTEYHANGSLYDYVKVHKLNVEQCLRIVTSLLEGVAFLHEETDTAKGHKPTIVHRDLKSKNVLIKDDLTACVADFGLAMKCDSLMQTVGTCGQAQVGTPRYMSPEVLEGATEFSAAAFRQIDVYATALVVWEVLSRTESSPQDQAPEYMMPYETDTGENTSLGKMRDLVVANKTRPKHRNKILEHAILKRVAETSEEMWDQEADGRITAGCALERLRMLARDSGAVSEEEHHDNGSQKSVQSAPSPVMHPRAAGGSLSSAGFNRAMTEYKNPAAAGEKEPLTTQTSAL